MSEGTIGRIGPHRLVFLLGNPVDHSLSPAIHNAAFAEVGVTARYQPLKVKQAELKEAVESLRREDVMGANVTIPHKEAVVALMDDLTPEAKQVGAVNTIVVGDEGHLYGANTDIEGFAAPLTPFREQLEGSSIVVFGSGGVARAACYALLTKLNPARLTVAARRIDRSEQLASDLATVDENFALKAILLSEVSQFVRGSQLVVNATPVGMTPNVNESPWPNVFDFNDGQVVYDLVYAPKRTKLLRDAASQGAATIGGMAMLVSQAAASFKLWTGRDMPMDAVQAALGDTF